MLGSSEFHGGSCPSSLPQCPEGYILVEGDSWGEALSTASDQDIKSCAALCTDLPGECCSFEWSPTERQCNLNRECAPSHEKFQDYLFCVKGAFKHNLLTNNWRKHRFYTIWHMTKPQVTCVTIGPSKNNLKSTLRQKRMSARASDWSQLMVYF